MATSLTSAATTSSAGGVGNARLHRCGVVAQPVDGVAVRERVDERSPTPSHITLALQRPSSTPSIGSASVSPAKRAGSSSTSATVIPARSGSSNWQLDAGEQQAVRLFLQHGRRRRFRHAGARHQGRLPFGDPLGALGGAFRRQARPDLRPQPVERLLFDNGQRRTGATVSSMSPTTTVGRGRILTQWRLDHRRPLEHQPLRRADHAVDDRPLQQLACFSDIHPAETGEPAAGVQRLQEPHRVGTVSDAT